MIKIIGKVSFEVIFRSLSNEELLQTLHEILLLNPL